jgi:dTMP kinase
MWRGLLIAFEGIDGAGKRTLSRYLMKLLQDKHLCVKVYDYPDYRSHWGKIIERYLRNEIELNLTEQFFTYFTDIYKDQVMIKTLLSKGAFIVVNRYFASTVAFQCAKGFSYDTALNIVKAAEIAIPDFSFFIKVEPEIAVERCLKRGGLDRHERDPVLLRKVNSLYEKLIRQRQLSSKWIIINSTKSLDCICKEMKNHVNLILKSLKN